MRSSLSFPIRYCLMLACFLPFPAASAPLLEQPGTSADGFPQFLWSEVPGPPGDFYVVHRRLVGSEEAWGAGTSHEQQSPPFGSTYVDRGGDGGALPDCYVEYEYRMQKWFSSPAPTPSDWSNVLTPVASDPSARLLAMSEVEFAAAPDADGDGLPDFCDPFSAGEECVGSGWTPSPSLPGVLADCDLDGATACTGEDIFLALQTCSALDGCVLQLEAGTYEDAAINIDNGQGDGWSYPHGCKPEFTHCLREMDTFANGLVVQGRGEATVVRPPAWSGSDTPLPLLRLYRRPDVRLRLRNIVLEGRKEDLADLTVPYNTWHHKGLEVSNYLVPSYGSNENGCVHNATARNFANASFVVSNAVGWIFEYSRSEHMGCHDTFTPCPMLGDHENVAVFANTNGYRVPGYGFTAGDHCHDITMRHNEARRITKYSFNLKGGSDGASGMLNGPIVHDNVVTDSGSRGLFLAGVDGAWVHDNLIEESHDFQVDGGLLVNSLAGITINGVVSNSLLERNTIRNFAGPAIQYLASGSGNVIRDTFISGSCKLRNRTSCDTATGKCYAGSDIDFANSATGHVTIEGTTVVDSDCSYAFSITSNSDVDVTLDGGLYESGFYAVEEQPYDPVNFHHIYYGGALHGGNGTLTLQGGVTLQNREDPENPGTPLNPLLQGWVLAFGEATLVVKSANALDFSHGYHLDDYKGGGTLVFCEETPGDPLCGSASVPALRGPGVVLLFLFAATTGVGMLRRSTDPKRVKRGARPRA